jgi:hypothetical protein
MILPLLRNHDLVGLFEISSTNPSAFAKSDERTLEMLAQDALKSFRQAGETRLAGPAADEAEASTEPCQVAKPETLTEELQPVYVAELASANGAPADGRMNFALGAAVFACAVLLSALVGFHLGQHRGIASYAHGAKTSGPAEASVSSPSSKTAGRTISIDSSRPENASARRGRVTRVSAARRRVRSAGAHPPVGSLLVYWNGEEVFRAVPPAQKKQMPADEN